MHTPRTLTLLAQLRRFVSATVCAATLVFLAGGLATASAQETAKRTFDLPADAAATTLKMFSQQSGRALVVDSDLVRGIRTNVVKGEFTVEEAMDLLLMDTGLVAAKDAKSGAYTVKKEGLSPNAQRAIANSDRPSRSDRSAIEATDGEGKPIVLDTFEVFGKKTLNMDIQRTRNDVQPYVVFTAENIANSGATNLEDFLRTRLPMNASQGSLTQRSNSQFPNNQSQINLRGLGQNQTLILLDGRRLPSVNGGSGAANGVAFGSAIQPDINGIPMAAIERVEVLSSTAGGIYGGGATGGVINIILKRSYNGASVALTYGQTADGNAPFFDWSLTFGRTFNKGRTRVMISASRREADPLFNGDRPFAAVAARLLTERLSFVINPPLGYTPNIFSTGNTPLVLDNGTPLNSTFASVPLGYAGPATDNGAGLVKGAGIYNRDLPEGTLNSNARGYAIFRGGVGEQVALNLRHELTPRIEVFLDSGISRNQAVSDDGALVSLNGNNRIILSAENPANPFQQQITVVFPTPNLKSRNVSNSDVFRTNVGVIADIGAGFQGEMDYSWARSRSHMRLQYLAGVGVLTPSGIAAFNSGAIDILRDVNQYPINFAPYLITQQGYDYGPFDTTLQDITARVSGPVVFGNGRKLTLSGSIGSRLEKLNDSKYQGIQFAGSDVINYGYVPGKKQQVQSAYLETKSTNLGGEAAHWLNSFEMQLSARWDRYITTTPVPILISSTSPLANPYSSVTTVSNNVQSLDSTIGLKWSHSSGLVIRGSYGTGFLAPALEQISPFTSAVPFTSVAGPSGLTVYGLDPKRGNSRVGFDSGGSVLPGSLLTVGSGNPDLQPETSESYSLGAVFSPKWATGLRLSIDYTRIKKNDEAQIPGPALIIANEDNYPGRVTRSARLANDPAEWAGPIVGLNTSFINVATSLTEALDFQLDYTKTIEPVGVIKLYAVATRSLHSTKQILPTSPTLEYVDSRSGPLEWRVNPGINVERGPWTFGIDAQLYSNYSINNPGDNAATRTSNETLQGAKRVPSQLYFDAFLRYRASGRVHRFLDGTAVTLVVQNVFDTEPPFVTGDMYSRYGDPRLRRFVLSVKKEF